MSKGSTPAYSILRLRGEQMDSLKKEDVYTVDDIYALPEEYSFGESVPVGIYEGFFIHVQ